MKTIPSNFKIKFDFKENNAVESILKEMVDLYGCDQLRVKNELYARSGLIEYY